MNYGTPRNYETHPIKREELVFQIMRIIDSLAEAKKVLDKFDKENK